MSWTENKTESGDGKSKPLTMEWLKFVIKIVVIAITAMIFLGMFDRRLTTLETEMKYKVGKEELFQKLDEMKKELADKLEKEISKIKK